MSIEDAKLPPVLSGGWSGYKAATAITMVCLATAIIVLAIDWQIKAAVIRAANDARTLLDEWKVLYAERPADTATGHPGQRSPVRRADAPAKRGDVLPRTPGVETGSTPDGPSAPGKRSSPARASTNGTAGNRSGGVQAGDKQVGA